MASFFLLKAPEMWTWSYRMTQATITRWQKNNVSDGFVNLFSMCVRVESHSICVYVSKCVQNKSPLPKKKYVKIIPSEKQRQSLKNGRGILPQGKPLPHSYTILGMLCVCVCVCTCVRTLPVMVGWLFNHDAAHRCHDCKRVCSVANRNILVLRHKLGGGLAHYFKHRSWVRVEQRHAVSLLVVHHGRLVCGWIFHLHPAQSPEMHGKQKRQTSFTQHMSACSEDERDPK